VILTGFLPVGFIHDAPLGCGFDLKRASPILFLKIREVSGLLISSIEYFSPLVKAESAGYFNQTEDESKVGFTC